MSNNRTSATLTIGGEFDSADDFFFNQANQPTYWVTRWQGRSDWGRGPRYDDDGNMIGDGGTAYTYDAAGRMIRSNSPFFSDNNLEFGYNALGARTSLTKVDPTDIITSRYVVDVNQPLPEVVKSTTGAESTFYVPGLGEKANNQWAYYGTDRLGSTRALFDGSGAMRATMDYDPYGRVISQSGDLASVFGYTGEQTDRSGQSYLRARYYDPELGSFLSRDPFEGTLTSMMSRHGYGYVHGNPVNYADPSGKFPWLLLGALALAGGVGATVGFVGGYVGSAIQQSYQYGSVDPIEALEAGTKSAVIGAVAGLVGAATGVVGAGLLARAGIYATTAGAGYYGAGVIAASGVTGGQAARWADNVLSGRDGATGLFNPVDMLFDATLAVGSTWALGSGLNRLTGSKTNYFASALFNPKRGSNLAFGNCGQNSFSADTEVATAEGDKPISTVQEGDKVLAYNEQTGTTGEYTVTDTIHHIDHEVVLVTINGELIETTPEHPFYTTERGWVNAADLTVGDHVRDLDGSAGEITAVERVIRTQPMYNLTVDQAHTFFVGDGRWLVHNSGGECFFNQKSADLAEELGNAESLGATRYKIDSREFTRIFDEDTIKWAVTQDGELYVMPKYVDQQEIPHTILTNGEPALAAGEANLARFEKSFFGVDINRHSGHYMPSAESLDIGIDAFGRYGITFLDIVRGLD